MSTDKPTVSVIIPAYNQGQYITESLDSVRKQTFTDWEVWVIDDGSKDQTAKVIKPYLQKDYRINYHYQENGGLSAARNKGLNLISGKYVQFLDSDDLIEEEKFQKQISYLNDHNQVDIIYGSVRNFHQPAERIDYSSWMQCVSGQGNELVKALFTWNIMVVNAPLIRFDSIKGMKFDESLKAHEDWDFWIRCALKGLHFKFLDLYGTRALVRLHDYKMSGDGWRMFLSVIQMRRKLSSIIDDLELKEAIINSDNYIQSILDRRKEVMIQDLLYDFWQGHLLKFIIRTRLLFRYDKSYKSLLKEIVKQIVR